jgi:hypothetical protein
MKMKRNTSYSAFDFSTVWAIRTDSTYPAIQGIDNAPFAFADTVFTTVSFNLDQLRANDYDYETLQVPLVSVIDSVSAGKIENGTYYFPNNIEANDTVYVYYKIGEVRAHDTLWGNAAISVIIAGPNTAPMFLNTSLQVNEDEVLKVGLNNLVDDNEGHTVSLTIINTAQNGNLGITGDTLVYSPGVNFNGADSLRAIASDGLLSDTAWVYISVNAVNDKPEINSSAPLTATVEKTYTYSVDASDVDGDELTYSLNGAPVGMSISGNEIKWKPIEGTTTSGEITLTVSDGELNATETFKISVSNNTAIRKRVSGNLSFYPNPVSSVLTIQCARSIEQIRIVATNGAIVLSEKGCGTKKQLDISHLQQGLYILQVKTGSETIVRSLCKE